MKKLLFTIISSLILCLYPVNALAYDFSVNPFYAIRSSDEYLNVKDTIDESDTIYFGWSRIVRDSEGKMVFTSDRNAISKFDINSEYSIPEPIGDMLPNEMRKVEKPGGKNMLMVFLNKINYDDGKVSIIEFLNMDEELWDKLIIEPMISKVDEYGFDGVALDIENIMDTFTTDKYDDKQNSNLKEKYNRFLKELKNKLNGRELSVCVNMPEYDGYDYSYIYDNADNIILIAYPYTHYTTYSESDGVPDLIGKIKEIDVPEPEPYDMVKSDTDKVVSILKQHGGSAFNPKKILLGITLQVNGWVQKEYPYGSNVYKYYEKASSLGADSKFNISSLEDMENINVPGEYVLESPVYKYTSRTYKKVVQDGLEDGIKKIEYYYDTPETLFEKYYTLLGDYDLSGITVWRLGLGGSKIWSDLKSIFSSNETYEELPSKIDVPIDKVWNVKFNMPIDEKLTSSSENISVLDAYKNSFPVKLKFDSNTNSVNILPVSKYSKGSIYYLIIGKDIKSRSGLQLSKPVIMKFKTIE